MVRSFLTAYPGLVTDGNRIYFTSSRNGAVAYLSMTGGDREFLSTPVRGDLRHISPDGSMLLVFGKVPGDENSHLWFVPTTSGGPRRLGEIDGDDGAWSPDGRAIVYAKDRDLFVSDGNGKSVRKLVRANGAVRWLRWSPDGRLIRFTVVGEADRNNLTLWECKSDGSDLHPLPIKWETTPQECCGEWSNDGRYFFFRALMENHSEIWQIRERGLRTGAFRPSRLTTGPLDVAAAVPSRDGHQLLTIESQTGSKIMRYDVNIRHLEPYLPGINVDFAATSANGEWVAYTEVHGKENILWRSRQDGSDRLPLTIPMQGITWPKWSPNAKQIAFWGQEYGKPGMVYVVDATGGTPHAVTLPRHRYVDPNWSPDGKSLMVGRPPDYLGERGAPKSIEIVNLETNQVTKLPQSDGLFSPHWSPDGRFVAASRLDQRQLLLFDFSTQTWKELASSTPSQPLWIDSVAWSPDSQGVYFNGYFNGLGAVIHVSRDGRIREQVLDLEKIDPDASFCAFGDTAWDGSLLITCWSEGGDIYRLDIATP
jgi:Tol biopolymer transport system component